MGQGTQRRKQRPQVGRKHYCCQACPVSENTKFVTCTYVFCPSPISLSRNRNYKNPEADYFLTDISPHHMHFLLYYGRWSFSLLHRAQKFKFSQLTCLDRATPQASTMTFSACYFHPPPSCLLLTLLLGLIGKHCLEQNPLSLSPGLSPVLVLLGSPCKLWVCYPRQLHTAKGWALSESMKSGI